MKFALGQPLTRLEDARLLTGKGRFTDDLRRSQLAEALILRSPYAHARIVSLDVKAASAMPGVLGIFTSADIDQAGVGDLPCAFRAKNADGSKAKLVPHPALARGFVRHVGEGLAMVVAESREQGLDALEAIEVEYEPLPPQIDLALAVAPTAAQVWPEAPGNICFDWEMGDAPAVAAAFAKAAKVVALDLVNNRVHPMTLEPRAALAEYDPAEDILTLYTGCQGVHSLQGWLAGCLKIDPARLRVVTEDVGGGFGMRLFLFPEHVLTAFAARKLKRPVKWVSDRSESFLADTHGRDNVSHAELALDADGRFLALKVESLANLGAYLSQFSMFVPTFCGSGMLAGLYTTPAIHVRMQGVFTNTAPVDAYRGAGRPEAAFLIERLVDKAAREIGISPVEIRRKNFIPAAALPYRTPLGDTYDSGDFVGTMEKALQAADWQGFPARREASRKLGKLRGIGLSTYVEVCGGTSPESAAVTFSPDGKALLSIGTQSTGQGHETAYAQLFAAELGVAPQDIQILQGDTAKIPTGGGTGGSRSLPTGGPLVVDLAAKVISQGKKAAARRFNVAESAIAYENAAFVVMGDNRFASLAELAGEGALDTQASFTPAASTFPNGCHICEIEIDPETGKPEVLAYSIVDDVGRVINPLLLQGQIFGGVAQGLGQALFEEARYDHESGQLLTGSLVDYALPRADDLPSFKFAANEIPCQTNPLGVKGAGEAGAIGSPPAAINAIIDALAEYGITHIDMPATAYKIWKSLREARKK
jgi:carbon-monoxide dehydrogenase large subunit